MQCHQGYSLLLENEINCNFNPMKPLFFIILTAFTMNGWRAMGQKNASEFTDSGVKLFESQDYVGAIISCNKAIELDKKFFIAYYMRGNIKRIFEDHHGAMKDYNMAIDLNPKFCEAYYERGSIKYSLQDYYGAIFDFSQTISLNDKFVDAYLKRGQAKHQLEAYNDAINDCSKIIEINPKNIDAFFLRGILRIEHGQMEGGCLDLSKAGELGDLKAYEMIREKCNNRCLQY
jgi:tetratricopeptide (TPR) repeat protein